MEKKIVYLVGGLSAVSLGVVIGSWIKRGLQARRIAAIRANYPKDTVIVHQISRGPYAPSISPFPVKLETFLRMANVPYQNDFELPWSTKGKTPWITLNGKDIADSQFAINEVKRVFDVDVDAHLSTEQRAIGHFMRRSMEEALYWVYVCWRWHHGYQEELQLIKTSFKDDIPSVMLGYVLKSISKTVFKSAWEQGTGRHTPEEIWSMGKLDLHAYSEFLGNNLFMLGSQPSEIDAVMFGFLAQIKWHTNQNSPIAVVFNSLPNLSEYCERMKDKFWPDWDDCITHGGTQKATK